MGKFLLTFIFVLLCSSPGLGQVNESYITEIEFKDRIEEHLRFFSDSLSLYDEDWKNGKGYFTIVIHEDSGPVREDSLPVRHYDVNYSDLDFYEDDGEFPLFYTQITGRPATIEFKSVSFPEEFLQYSISRKSIRKFRKVMKPFLFERIKIYDPDSPRKKDENPQWYRPQVVKLNHVYMRITVFLDGSTKRKLIYDQ